MIAIIMFSIMVFLLLAGLPVAIMLGVVSTAWVMSAGRSIQMIASRMYAGIDMFVLMAIPFFCLAGEIMNRCGITDRLIKFVDYLIGRVRGGLAQAQHLQQPAVCRHYRRGGGRRIGPGLDIHSGHGKTGATAANFRP